MYTADLDFIMAHLAESQQTIIELACGTGRLAIPLAKQGHTVYGVDIDTGMLEYAQEKVDSEGINIHLSVQDCTQLNLPIKSNFIYMTGNSFQHFLTNESQDALFMSVKKHLNPKGEIINLYGSWTKTIFNARSISMVVHARLKRFLSYILPLKQEENISIEMLKEVVSLWSGSSACDHDMYKSLGFEILFGELIAWSV